MGGKGKNKYKAKGSHSNKPHNSGQNHVPTEQQVQILMTQCLLIHELLNKNMKQLQNETMCHLLSKKWLEDWKKYVGYEQITKGKMQEGRIPKGMGGRHPGSINQNMKRIVKDYYQIPKEMPEYSYLNIFINDKLDKGQDYIPVGLNLWQALLQRYQVLQDIPRPVRKTKSSFYYDSNLITVDAIFVDHLAVQQALQVNGKLSKNDRCRLFDSKKMQISQIWQFQDLQQFLKQYVSHTFNVQKKQQTILKIWKAANYMDFTQINNNISEQIVSKKYELQAQHLKTQDLQDLDLDQFIKCSQNTLIIQFNGLRFKQADVPQKIRGYCEQCVKVKQLLYRCQCSMAHYCSMQCLVDDRIFHSKACSEAFNSQDDQQYQSKKVQLHQELISTGLQNLGNTCYMNSSFQFLLSALDFRDFFGSNQYLEELKQNNVQDTRFIKKLSKFCKKLFQAKKSLSPWSIKSQVNSNMNPFKGYKQHDANDFLTNFITVVNECLKQYKEEPFHPLIKNNFLGYFDSHIECPSCKYKVQNIQIFTQITLPIRHKPKKHFYSYAVIRKDQIVRGKAQIAFDTWQQILESLGVGNKAAAIYEGKQGDHLWCLDRDQSPQKQIRSLKGKQLIIFPEIVVNEGEQQFSFIQTSIKKISGIDAKYPVGYPFIVKVDPRITTIMEFWIQIVRDFVEKQVVDRLVQIQKQFITSTVQKDIQQTQAEKQKSQKNKQANQIQLKDKKSKEKQTKLEQDNFKMQIQEKFRAVLNEEGIQVCIEDSKRHKNICHFCKKKCRNCTFPVLAGVSVEEYLGQKIQDVRFQISFKTRKIANIETKNLGSSDPNLQQCLELFKIPEQLDEQNAWWCQICEDMRLAIKTISIKTLPKYLIIQLSRFKSDGDRKIKNNQPIQYNQIQSFQGQQYKLLAVIIHQGSMEAGHYWAICLRGNRYYIYNDEKVTQTEKVCNKGAYILMYKRIQ